MQTRAVAPQAAAPPFAGGVHVMPYLQVGELWAIVVLYVLLMVLW